ncbi:MAG TPA: hypothetical protein VKU60_01720 [Chloroflexota bacterium]|nr:hypothetical protein [Chloroflexota bacterium]
MPQAPTPNDPNPLGNDPDAYLERLSYRETKTDHGKLGYVMGLGLLFVAFMTLFLCGLVGSFFLHSPFIQR